MTKVTIIKNYRNNITLRQLDLSEVVQAIQGQTYEELCEQLRHVYPLVEVRQKYDAMDGLIQPGWFRGGRGGAERCQSDSLYPIGIRGCQRTER